MARYPAEWQVEQVIYMSHNYRCEAKAFYYTDTTDEKHPFNLMNGPLDTPYIPVPKTVQLVQQIV